MHYYIFRNCIINSIFQSVRWLRIRNYLRIIINLSQCYHKIHLILKQLLISHNVIILFVDRH